MFIDIPRFSTIMLKDILIIGQQKSSKWDDVYFQIFDCLDLDHCIKVKILLNRVIIKNKAIKNDEFFFLFRVKPVQSLFSGIVKMSANMTDSHGGEIQNIGRASQCLIQPSDQDLCKDRSPKNVNNGKKLRETVSILDDLIDVGINEDFAPFTFLGRSEESNSDLGKV